MTFASETLLNRVKVWIKAGISDGTIINYIEFSVPCSYSVAKKILNLALYSSDSMKSTILKYPVPKSDEAIIAESGKMEDFELPSYVSDVQNIVLENISKPSGLHGKDASQPESIFNEIVKYDKSVVRCALGDFGVHLQNFAECVYHDHPSLAEINNATLMQGGKVYIRIKEALKLGEFMQKESLGEMQTVLGNWMTRNHPRITKVLLKPPARLIKDENQRKEVRSILKTKELELEDYVEGRGSYWGNLPESFVPFTRMGPGLATRLKALKKSSERLAELGFINNRSAISSDITNCDEIISDRYYGFVKIRMFDAAMIAARSAGFEWHYSNECPKVTISTKHFKQNFWSDGGPAASAASSPEYSTKFRERRIKIEEHYVLGSRIKNSDILKSSDDFDTDEQEANYIHLPIKARAYPLHNFCLPKPKNVDRILNELESYVDTNGRPLFDNYWVIMASVSLPAKSKEYYEYFDNGVSKKFSTASERQTSLDKQLVLTGQAFPVILGEQTSNKKCYFISFWA